MVNKGWRKEKLHKLGFLGRGKSKHRPRNDNSLFGGDYPFIQTGDVKAANLYISEYKQTYNDKGLSQSKLWESGTLCLTIAANIAETGILSMDACFPDSIVGFQADPNKADTKFIKYYIDTIKKQMSNVSQGATQENLSLDKIKLFDFYIPLPKTQQKIAGVLSTYDDLIENNNRRIQILEDMAQKLYKHWFIDFKFPNHENTKFIKSDLGLIPDGWEVKKIENVINIYRGKSYKSSELSQNEGLPFLNLKSVKRDGGFRRDGLKWFIGKYKEHHIVKPKEMVMAVTDMTQERRIVARCARIPHNWYSQYILSMDLVRLVSKEESLTDYYYSMLKFSSFANETKIHANGANVLHLSPKSIDAYEFICPDEGTAFNFSQLVINIYNLIDIYEVQKEEAMKTRDLLLPRLISGELDISELEVAA